MLGGGGSSEHHHCCYREQLGYAWYATFREPRLFRMVVAGDWDLVPARCRSHPKEAAFVHKYPPADTALHRILRPTLTCEWDADTWEKMNDLRVAAVVALLEAHPPAAIVRDSFGRTPLHWACMNVDTTWSKGGGQAARIIAETNPDAVSMVDSEQRTALHALVARCHGAIPLDLLSLLLSRDPSVVDQKDVVGDTPLDIVQRRWTELPNAKAVLDILQTTRGVCVASDG